MALQFEWDEKKAKLNLKNHRISFEMAATIFGDELSITLDDISHSVTEERFITIGSTQKGLVVVVCHCDRPNKIRIISARKATKTEKKQYDEKRI